MSRVPALPAVSRQTQKPSGPSSGSARDKRSAVPLSRAGSASGGGTGRENKDSKRDGKKKEILVDRTVIDEHLIRDAVREELLTMHDPSSVPPASELDLLEVSTLILSFQNIYQIDNLLGFERLTKLQLDNNIIEKIENLDHLVNLEWLDLSFNNITRIEGLNTLVNLTDLSLFNNQIEKIENLENLSKLNVLSLGRNRIRDLESIKDLRRFKNLRCLNLKHNPVCDDDQYRNTVFAFVTSLKYLDYQLIEAHHFQKAADAYQDTLNELKEKDKVVEAEQREEKKENERKAMLAEAHLDGVHSLWQDIIKEDPEQLKLRILPGYQRILNEYKTMFEKATGELQADILAAHTLKREEHKLFLTVRDKVTGDMERKSIDKIQAFDARKKDDFKAWEESIKRDAPDKSILTQLDEAVSALYDQLMDYEMLQVEQMDSVLDEFKENYNKYVQENLLRVASTFKTLLDVAKNYEKTVQELVKQLAEKYAKEDAAPAAAANDSATAAGDTSNNAEAAKMITTDKDAVTQSVTNSAQFHVDRIINKDDSVRDRESKDAAELIAAARKAEYQRNRHRVTEIQDLTQRLRRMIATELARFQEAEDD